MFPYTLSLTAEAGGAGRHKLICREDLLVSKEQIEVVILNEIREIIKNGSLEAEGFTSFSILDSEYTLKKITPTRVQVTKKNYKTDEKVSFTIWGNLFFYSSNGIMEKDSNDINITGEATIDFLRNGNKTYLITTIIDNQLTLSKK